MWGFKREPEKKDLEERVERLERRLKEVEMEWETWYEKARRLLWRVTKRAEAAAEVSDPQPTAENHSGGILEAKVDPISAKILARRKNRGILPG